MSNTSETPNPYSFQIMDLKNKIKALDISIIEMLRLDYSATADVLLEIRDEIEQKMKDLEIDSNVLPFPEK